MNIGDSVGRGHERLVVADGVLTRTAPGGKK